MSPHDKPDLPFLRVVNADATSEEIAALVAVLGALQTPTTPTRARPSGWSDATHRLRQTIHHGPGAWRASTLPR